MPGSMEPFSPAFPPLVPAEASRHQFKVHHLFSKLKVGKKLTQQVPGPVSAKQNPSALSAHLGRYLAGRGHLLNPKIPDFPSFPCVFVTGKTKKLLQGFFSQLCLWKSLKAPCLMVLLWAGVAGQPGAGLLSRLASVQLQGASGAGMLCVAGDSVS